MVSLVSYQVILEGNGHKKNDMERGQMLVMLSSTLNFPEGLQCWNPLFDKGLLQAQERLKCNNSLV